MAFPTPTIAQSQDVLKDGTTYFHRTAIAPSKPIAAKDILGACVSDFRGLINAAPAIYCALRRIRVDIAYDAGCESLWTTFLMRYRCLLDESDSARGELLAITRIYLALQGNTTPDDIDEMITELLGLQEQLASRHYQLDAVCSALENDIKTWHSKFSDSALCETERRNASGGVAGNGDEQPFGVHGIHTLPMRLGMSLVDALVTRVYKGCHRIWAMMSRGVVASSRTPPSSPCGVNTTGSAVYTNTRHPDERSAVPSAAAENGVKRAIEELVAESVRQLGTQAQRYGAFNELTKHLRNEVGAYLLAFQRFKAIPNYRNSKALKEMHARVASSSPRWRECIAVLDQGFACV